MLSKKGSRQGFTLIELLVVIAIIAILAAILFPVFAKAREKARQASCLSNNKQMGTAIIMYLEDWDETYPENWGYFKYMIPYVKNNGVFHCPSDRKRADDRDPSYLYNGWLGWTAAWGAAGPATESMIGAPASLALVWEKGDAWPDQDCTPYWAYNFTGNWWQTVGSGYPADVNQDPNTPVTQAVIGTARHNGGMNMQFCDGHAKWYKLNGSSRYTQQGITNWPPDAK